MTFENTIHSIELDWYYMYAVCVMCHKTAIVFDFSITNALHFDVEKSPFSLHRQHPPTLLESIDFALFRFVSQMASIEFSGKFGIRWIERA